MSTLNTIRTVPKLLGAQPNKIVELEYPPQREGLTEKLMTYDLVSALAPYLDDDDDSSDSTHVIDDSESVNSLDAQPGTPTPPMGWAPSANLPAPPQDPSSQSGSSQLSAISEHQAVAQQLRARLLHDRILSSYANYLCYWQAANDFVDLPRGEWNMENMLEYRECLQGRRLCLEKLKAIEEEAGRWVDVQDLCVRCLKGLTCGQE